MKALFVSALALSLSTRGATSLAQTVRHPALAAPSKTAPRPADDLTERLTSEQRTVQAGDPAQIAVTSRALAAIALQRLANVRLAQGRPAEAIDLFDRSIELNDLAETRLELASSLLRSGQPVKAAEAAARVTETDPRSAIAWTIRGSALRSTGDDRGAADAFGRSLQLHPDASVAYAMGSALLAAHDKGHADPVFQRVIAASGNDAVWHVAVGDSYRDSGYLDEAIVEFKKALARDPRAPHAEFFLGLTYLQLHQWGPSSESFEHLRAAIRQNPREYVSNFYLGALESTDGSDLPSSDRHLLAAAAADPSQPEVWLYLGQNANREKRTSEAKQYLEKAIALTGSDEGRNNYQVRRAYFALGRLLIAEGKREEGTALLAKYSKAEQAAVAQSGAYIAQQAGTGDASHTAVDLASSSAAQTAKPAETAIKTPLTQLSGAQQEQLKAGEAELRTILASAYNDLGTAEARQQRYAEALTDFQQAEHWSPPNGPLLRNLGVAAFRVEQYEEAERALSLYVRSSAYPATDARPRVMLAYSQFSLGKFREAAESFAGVSEDMMRDPRSAYAWAFSLARSGQQLQANHLADDLVKRELPSDVLGLVCHIYVDTEDYEQSKTCYRRAYTQDPEIKLAHYQVGEALIRLDRPAEAIPELRKELELSPGNPNVQSSLAFALLQTSQREEARTLLAKVTTSAPEQAEAQYQYGKLLLEDDRAAEALPHLVAAERLDPEKDYVHYQLQSAYRRVGRAEDAAREAATYREIKAKHREAATPQRAQEAHP